MLLALRIHADGNFLQVIGDTVGVNELTVFGRGGKPFEIKSFAHFYDVNSVKMPCNQ